MARIQQIKHPDGDVIYPISHTNAIIDDSGNRLENVLQDLKLNSSIWRITEDNGVENTRTNGSINLGTGISVYQHTLEGNHQITISNSDGINISDGSPEYISIGTNVRIGSAVRIEGAINMGANLCIGTGDPYKDHSTENVFIGNRVYIESGFDSRNISSGSGGTGDDLWALELGTGVTVNRPDEHINIVLGTDIRIGTDGPVDIGSNVYIESGFDSRNISGGSGSGDGLWKVEGNLLTSKSSNRNIQLGTEIFIGTSGSVTIEGNLYGIQVYTDSNQSAIVIGTNVKIGTSNESIEIGQNGIQINDSFGDKSIFIGSQVHISAGFDSRKYLNSDGDLNPESIPTDSSLKSDDILRVNIEPQSNGNIKIGDTLFMPATPSGDPMHYAYIAAGAEYNATTDFIVKDAPWKDMVDTIEDKAKWGFDVVDASQVKQMTIGGTTYNYVQTTRQSPEGTTEPRYFFVGKGSNGVWVEDETKVLHLPGHWYLNGLGDITGPEIALCYVQTMPWYAATTLTKAFRVQQNSDKITLRYRTTFRSNREFATIASNIDCESMCYGNTYIEVFILTFMSQKVNVIINGLGNAFTKANNMKYLIGQLYSSTSINLPNNIRSLSITINQSVNFAKSSYISKPSILYTIQNAMPSVPITITLHADRYAQLSEDVDIVAALEAKNTELEGTGGSISLVSA